MLQLKGVIPSLHKKSTESIIDEMHSILKEMQKEKKNDLAMDNVIESTKSKYDGGYILDWLLEGLFIIYWKLITIKYWPLQIILESLKNDKLGVVEFLQKCQRERNQ